MKNLLLFILFFFALACTSVKAQTDLDSLESFDYSAVKTFEIGGIKITGAESRDRNAIKSIAGLREGKTIKIPGDDIPKALKSLWKLRLFDDVRILQDSIEDNLIFLEIVLIERPILSRHSFKGIKKTSHEALNDILDRILNKGSIVTDDVKTLSVDKIKEHFVNKGFFDTKVKVTEIKDEIKENAVRLVFDIDTGDRIKVASLVILGNRAITDKKLLRKMSNTKVKGTLLKKSKFVTEEFKADKKELINFYNSKGYRNAKIVDEEIRAGFDGDLHIKLEVEEGNQFYFRNITWKGNAKYTADQLRNVLGIYKGDVYNPELLESRLSFSPDGRDISSLYLDDGYLFFRADPVEVAIVGDSIDIVMEVFEGPQATIQNVVIKGNDRTHEHVVRRELRTKPGNKFSRSDIIRSQRQIMNLGYFNPETMDIQTPVNQQRGTVDIIYDLEETPSDQLELSAGYGGASGLIGTLGVTFNNFSLRNIKDKSTWSPLPQGDGQKLSLRVQSNSRFFRSYNFTLTEPWLGGSKPNSFTLGGAHSSFDLSTIGSGSLFITRLFVGLGTQLKWPDDFFSSSTTLTTEWINMNDYNTGNFFVEGREIFSGNFKNFSIRQVFSRSSVSEPIYPKRGSRVSLSLQITPPYSIFRGDDYYILTEDERARLIFEENQIRGSGNPMSSSEEADFLLRKELGKKYEWLEYHKWRFDAEWYYSLVGNLVLASNVKMGFLGNYNDKIGISPFERFELGGDGLSNQNVGINGKDIIALRGYEVNDLAVNDIGGASIFNKYTIELRYPLSTNPSSTIYMHTFVQGGNSFTSFRDYNPFDLKRSAGFGMRVFLPMFGLLGFDYGWGFDKQGNYGKFSIVLGFEPD